MTKAGRSVGLFLVFLSVLLPSYQVGETSYCQSRGFLEDPIIDSAKTTEKAFEGLDPRCPKDLRKRQKVVKVLYYSFDNKIHQGQLVIDRALENDVKTVFEVALRERFPVHSVIPISDPSFRKDGRWDDDLSMEANNTSGFNYRQTTGGGKLSNHAYGRAVDINPFQNPYVKDDILLPKSAKYDPSVKGTLTSAHPIVRAFQQLGWKWGGDWITLKDYQHFEKPRKE